MDKKDITIVIATSVLPSHPSTRIIDETINSVRYHFPENEIILQIDGLREERLNRKDDYDEYKNIMLWKCLHEYKNVIPFIFDEHSHQTTMMKKTISEIKTELMIYIEGDTPLVTDVEIDWQKCIDFIDSGNATTIRFHFESEIPKEHDHLMFGMYNGFMKTNQWSQRPHITKTSYYKNTILPIAEEKTFIEDEYHSVLQTEPWLNHKLWIYHPEGNIKRSYHLDGREGGRKFTKDDEVWGLTE